MKKKSRVKLFLCIGLCFLGLILNFLPTGVQFLWQLLMLISGCFALYVAGNAAADRFPKLKKTVFILKCIFWGCFFLCLGTFLVVESLILSEERTEKNIPNVEYVLVLGAGVNGETMSAMLWERVNAAYSFWQTHPSSVLILCGGQGPGEWISEAECMARWFLEKGVPEDQLILEDQSTNTKENIANARELLTQRGVEDSSAVAVVTTGFHLYRAKELARQEGFVPYGISARLPRQPFFWLNYHCREFVSVLLMWFR